ncbi:lysozyme inhibitor LprI family protein [Aestuariibaculum sp. YM273]|uniref:lysozyme inhibitor LprI family protein n=1 Tax=Aestuariibaculum sp. YM273 TaxID=3070659 RepID=UPI0027DBFBCF|nr:lysozyme inhibitor LprI family protein [Aestuariibaculum sp. YM273]WMI65083.1 lysozyme inhibitor LprI family protein [Aestuariibaculum sp. YM273]
MKIKLILPLLFLFVSCCNTEKKDKTDAVYAPEIDLVKEASDYKMVLDNLTKLNQERLDTGIAMLQTEKLYYTQMDSMLNVVYKDLINTYNKTNFENLRKQQRQWLKERDAFFRKMQDEYQKESGEVDFLPNDYKLMVYGEKSSFVKERVLTLINLLDKN